MVSSVKLPILMKGEYILWTMKMEQYLAHTDYAIWEIYGNAESKKMQKNVLKQQFETFSVSNSEGLNKGSLLSAWSNISLIMRNKPGIDNLDIDDMYNNLKVYEADIKGSSRSSSNSQNVVFVFAESSNSTNELNDAYSVSTTTGHSSQAQGSSSYAEELMDCRSARNSRNMSRNARNAGYRGRDNGKRPAKEEDEQALVVYDGLDYLCMACSSLSKIYCSRLKGCFAGDVLLIKSFSNGSDTTCGDQLKSLVDPSLIDLSSLLKLSHLG
nr:ribonuclease H-like domain-containing protein [Tanacetum cinerariifolium]